MKVVKKYHRSECCICLENYGSSKSKTGSLLYSTDGCTHRVCPSCMEVYADHVVKQQQDNRISTLDCPVQGCKETFQLDQVISKALPFRHRLVFWWRQMSLRPVQDNCNPKKATKSHSVPARTLNIKPATKPSLARAKQPTFASRVRSNKPSSSLVVPPAKARNPKKPKTTWKVTSDEDKPKKHSRETTSVKVVSGSAASSSSSNAKKPVKDANEEFVEFALAKNWSRCPRCRHAVERISGCNYIYCRCGANFCYCCGKQHGYHHAGCPDKLNVSELRAVRKAMFQN